MNKIKVNFTTLLLIISIIYMNKFKKIENKKDKLENKWDNVKLSF
tara:strand:- start:405 stop:539 length:135 start_codon:yes stop_codon:yes gene_type:complete